MYERITAKDAERAYDEAMNAAQAEMAPIRADAANKQTNSRYATFVALDKALRPIYTRHGFSLSFDTGDGAPEGHVRVVCHVSHSGGDARHPHIDMPADGKGAKGNDVMTRTHATGAAITYGQRYLLKMVFNIAVGDDDDGNAPKAARQMSDPARKALETINAAEGPAALALWKKQEAEKLASQVPPGELQAVIDTYNRRVEHFKAQAAAS